MSDARRGPGRPPKYVRDSQGREIIGLRLHVATGRYYDIGEDGRRVYFGTDFSTARARHRRWQTDQAPTTSAAVETTDTAQPPEERDASTPATRRKARLRQRLRSDILTAALALFLKKDFHDVSMREIATSIGIGTGTLYNYFENKEALIHEIIKTNSQRVSAETVAPLNGSGDEAARLRAFIANYHKILLEHGEGIKIYFRQQINLSQNADLTTIEMIRKRAHMQQMVARTIQSGIDHGLFRPLNANLSAISLVATIEAVCMHCILSNEFSDAQDTIQQLQTSFLSGVMARI